MLRNKLNRIQVFSLSIKDNKMRYTLKKEKQKAVVCYFLAAPLAAGFAAGFAAGGFAAGFVAGFVALDLAKRRLPFGSH